MGRKDRREEGGRRENNREDWREFGGGKTGAEYTGDQEPKRIKERREGGMDGRRTGERRETVPRSSGSRPSWCL